MLELPHGRTLAQRGRHGLRRQGVTTVGDLYNVIGETFIFKEVYLEAFEKEQLRVARLLERLQQDGLPVQRIRLHMAGSGPQR